MAKTKTCSWCGKDVEKLWYSNPKTCMDYKCRQKYNEAKSAKGGLPKQRKQISPISEKKAKELVLYRKVRDEYFREHPICEFLGCYRSNIELHHMCGRQGPLLTDKRYFKSLCREHHRWVEENPDKAKRLGLSDTRTDK